ncbi:MAG: ABC transporter ATP-binding protein [Burkholderiales bacterium]
MLSFAERTGTFPQLIRTLFDNIGTKRILALVTFVLVINTLELVGLSLFVPIIDLFQGKSGQASTFTHTLSGIVATLGMPPVLPIFLLLLCLLFIVKTALIMWVRYLSVDTASAIQNHLRARLFSALLGSRMDFINGKRQGVLLSTLSEHTVRTGQAFFIFVQIIAQWVTVAAYATFVLWISWQLTLFALLLGLGTGPAIRRIGRLAHRHGKAYTLALEDSQHQALEALNAKKLVNAMNWAIPLENRFRAGSDSVRMHWQWMAFWANSPGIIIQPISVIILSGIIWFSLSYQLSVALLGAFVLAFIRMLPAIQTAISMGADFQANRPSMDSVLGMIEEAEKAIEPSGKQSFAGLKNGILLEDIRYHHGNNKPVLDGLNLDISKGSTVALIGPSGTGKTTVADLIVGLYRPAYGRVLIDGIDLVDIDLRQLRSHIAYVPQEPILFHDTIRNNLTLGLDRKIGDEKLKSACERVGAWEFVANRKEGLDSVIGDRGVQLSGGQRQRLALARALLRNPEILILDEATSALDNESEQWVKAVLSSLQESGQFTIIVIAHRYTTIQHADMIYEVRNGTAVPLGNWKQARDRLDH